MINLRGNKIGTILALAYDFEYQSTGSAAGGGGGGAQTEKSCERTSAQCRDHKV